jgi:hypothetical protein
MIGIPKQLRRKDFRFILLKDKQKIPLERDWPKVNNYCFDDLKLLKHLENGGNYGVGTGHGMLLVIDFDDVDFERKIRPLLPATFTVRTGSGGTHLYFIVDDNNSFKIHDKNKNTLADIQGIGKQVVGPNSTHPNGKKYNVANDAPIVKLSLKNLRIILNEYLKEKDKFKLPYQKDSIVEKIKANISLKKVMGYYGYDLSKNGTMCKLGHESNSKACFRYNLQSSLWICNGCQESGDMFSLVMVHEKCDFIEAKRKLAEMAGINVQEGKEGKEGKPVKMFFPTNHLPFFSEFCEISGLEGEDYTPVFKGIYFHCLSKIVFDRINTVKIGKLFVDLRIHIFAPLPSGQGKSNLKHLISTVLVALNLKGHVPTSLHPEQLIGKVINVGTRTKPRWEENRGYLSRDFLIFDEIHFLLTSKDQNMQESRKNLRIAKDTYSRNRVEKKSVENTFEQGQSINYFPGVISCEFSQPKALPEHIVEEGDLRRNLILFVKGMADRDKEEDYKNRLNHVDNSQEVIRIFKDYCISVRDNAAGKNFTFTPKAIKLLITLHKKIISMGYEHSKKGKNFTKMVDFTIQDFLVKISCVIGATRGVYEIGQNIVRLAYCDLIEFFSMQLDFAQDKVLGTLDYGEGWKGSRGKDQKCLEWLYNLGAVSEEKSSITIAEFKQKISEIKNVGLEGAKKHYERFKRNNWIDAKQRFQSDTGAWLKFAPKDIGHTLNQEGKECNWYNTYCSIISNQKSMLASLPPLLPLPPYEEEIIKSDHGRTALDNDNYADVRNFIEQHPKNNAVQVDEKFPKDLIQKLKDECELMENPSGTYRLINGGSLWEN